MKPTILKPGTLFRSKRITFNVDGLYLVIRGPFEDSKLNIHRVYRFVEGGAFPYIPTGTEEIVE